MSTQRNYSRVVKDLMNFATTSEGACFCFQLFIFRHHAKTSVLLKLDS